MDQDFNEGHSSQYPPNTPWPHPSPPQHHFGMPQDHPNSPQHHPHDSNIVSLLQSQQSSIQKVSEIYP